MKESIIKKPKLLVSVSGGETSMYMAIWLWNHKQDEYDMVFVFANTGDENEETLRFIHSCEKTYGFKVRWIEAKVDHRKYKGTKFTEVDFVRASRSGLPFEAVVSKYGLPNQSYPHCTRELKLQPIEAFARHLGMKDYFTAIGIRIDETDRISVKRHSKQLLYPLIQWIPMTKAKINFWWNMQSFRLNLKGYQGNCKACWKKSNNKLYQIARETPEAFKVARRLELKYSDFFPQTQQNTANESRKMFRGNRTSEEVMKAAYETSPVFVSDDSQFYENQLAMEFDLHNESCEIYAECGIDN